MHSRSLIDRLGGKAGVSSAVANLYERLLEDADVAPYFDDVNLPALRTHMVDFLIAAITGSETGYAGRPLDEAHRGLGVTDLAFDRVVGHLTAVLEDAGTDDATVGQVVEQLTPLRAQVVLPAVDVADGSREAR
jgi:hemoglobin